MTWAVKVSKLCNLRCQYCYEWEDLDNRAFISLTQWEKILAAVREFHQWQTLRFGESGRTFIVWHGGEPLLMPLAYFKDVLEVQREILSEGALGGKEFVNAVQTNLYRVQDAHLSILERERFELGVSLDVVPGIRLNLAGTESEKQVKRNLSRVLDRRIPVMGAVVLARHTHKRLREVYDFFEDLQVPFRVIPLHGPPPAAPAKDLIMTDPEHVYALQDLFVYWLDKGAKVRVEPLATALRTVLLHMTALESRPYHRREEGDRLLIVNTDGALYPALDRYAPGKSLGNIFEQPLGDIFRSPTYEISLSREELRVNETCGACRYRKACDSTPLVQVPETPFLKRCRVYEALCEYIETFLCREGMGKEDLRQMMNLEQEGVYSFSG